MSTVLIVAIAVAYCIIGGIFGGFVVGVMNESPDGFWIFCMIIWPVSLFISLIILMFRYPYKLGEWIGEKVWYKL